MDRFLIVNADDFGRSVAINRGVIRAHKEGIVTSASLMVRWPAAKEAAQYGSTASEPMSLGLHVDLGEWTFKEGNWVSEYSVVEPEGEPVREELLNQWERFRELAGRYPSHLDSHQHCHRSEPVKTEILALARKWGIPVREMGRVRWCGAFYGQAEKGKKVPDMISVERLTELIRGLGPGVTELSCHPGELDEDVSMYSAERAKEIEALCHPSVRMAIEEEGISLISFDELPRESSLM